MFAVIMAGGVGTRFWPRSRRRRPKQLLPIASDASMLRVTVERLRPLVELDQILVVTGEEQASLIRAELPEIPAGNILVEPVGRNTAPCIGLAAAVLQARGAGSEAMVVLAADHVVRREESFRKLLRACDTLLAAEDHLLTFGIQPHRPETGYGYIRTGALGPTVAGQRFLQVERFVEKPDLATAERLVADGRHLWNSGMFAWRIERIRGELERHLPALAPGLARLQAEWGTPRWDEALKAAYDAFPSQSIDYGVMEKASGVLVAGVDIGWSDVGSWASLPELRATDPRGNVIPDDGVAIDAERNIVEVGGKTVVLLGVSDLIVVDESDALLICRRDRAQQVGSIPARLADMGREDLT